MPKISRVGNVKKSTDAGADQLIDTEELAEMEDQLRAFDLNPRYGPCVGMSRMERWQRAEAFKLTPPVEIHLILSSKCASYPDIDHNLWWDIL